MLLKRFKRLNEALPLLLIGIFIYGCLLEIVGVWFVSDKIRYTTGLLIGIACAMGMAINIASVIEESVRIGEGHVKYLAAKSVFRYIVVCLVFFLTCYFELGNLLTAALGVLGLKVSAYAQPLLYKLTSKLQGGDEVKETNESLRNEN